MTYISPLFLVSHRYHSVPSYQADGCLFYSRFPRVVSSNGELRKIQENSNMYYFVILYCNFSDFIRISDEKGKKIY